MDYIKQQITSREEMLIKINADVSAADDAIAKANEDKAAAAKLRLVVEAELRAYKDALAHSGANTQPEQVGDNQRQTRTRGLSRVGKDLVGCVFLNMPEQTTLDGLYNMSRRLGHGIKDDSIRSQVAGYVKRDFIERVSPGRFSSSQECLEEAGITPDDISDLRSRLKPERETPDTIEPGVTSNGEGATSPNEGRWTFDRPG